MTAYILLGAATSWLFAQIALALMVHLGFDRKYVGMIAVAVAVVTPLMGSVASYGLWWWDPYPFTRFWTWLWQTLRRPFTWGPRG